MVEEETQETTGIPFSSPQMYSNYFHRLMILHKRHESFLIELIRC